MIIAAIRYLCARPLPAFCPPSARPLPAFCPPSARPLPALCPPSARPLPAVWHRSRLDIINMTLGGHPNIISIISRKSGINHILYKFSLVGISSSIRDNLYNIRLHYLSPSLPCGRPLLPPKGGTCVLPISHGRYAPLYQGRSAGYFIPRPPSRLGAAALRLNGNALARCHCAALQPPSSRSRLPPMGAPYFIFI